MSRVPPTPRYGVCRACSAPIVWLITAAGKLIPVNSNTVETGDVNYEHGRHVSHFTTCPKAGEFRRRRK